jgi:hypothetical protein
MPPSKTVSQCQTALPVSLLQQADYVAYALIIGMWRLPEGSSGERLCVQWSSSQFVVM